MRPASGLAPQLPAARLTAAGETVLLGWSAGLLAGSLQALVLLTTRYGFRRLLFYGQDVSWMAPLGNGLVFGGIALLLAGFGLLTRIRIRAALAAAAFAFLGVFVLLLPYQAIARWAVALLALAVAVQLGRSYGRAPDRWKGWAARTAAVLSLATLVAALGQQGIRWVRRTAAVHAQPAARSGAPNVLLVIWDTVRGEELSLFGYPIPTTPALARWAAQGVVFEQAFSTAPWTLPSHASLFTGQLGDQVGGSWLKPVALSFPTVAAILRDHGYRTGGFAANLLYTARESGLTKGFIDYRDYPLSLSQILLHCPLIQTNLVQAVAKARSLGELRLAFARFNLNTGHAPGDEYVPAGDITDHFLRWQSGLGDRPFFAFLNYFDAHGPYRSPPAFRERLAPGGKPRERYDAAIAYLDAETDRLLKRLEARGVLDRTLVIVAADHGELFGEHELRGHANALYLPLLRVPLVLRYPPGIPAGLRVADAISLRDLPATMLELAGGISPGAVPGTTLSGFWHPASRSAPPSPIVATVGRSREGNPRFPNARTGLQSLTEPEYRYIRSGLGREELYQWRRDSLELHNLAADPARAALLADLRARLQREMSRGTEAPSRLTAARP